MKKHMILIVCTLVCLTLIANFGTASVIPNTPSKPELLNYTISGKTNTSYNYTVRSTSPDNKSIKYVFDWGNNTNTTTGFFQSGTNCTVNHTWTAAGIYSMWVEAIDNESVSSEKIYLAVLIDAISVQDKGYLIDENSNGTYDIFYSNTTKNETTVQKQNNETYLIDSNGDAKWDYIYDQKTGILTSYSGGEEASGETKPSNVLWYALTMGTIIGIALLVAIFLIYEKIKKK